jgi:hypothetical protein
MKVIKPILIPYASLISSNAAETVSAYNPAINYTPGQQVYIAATETVYECVQNNNLGYPPPASAYWIEIGPTNRWAMFDSQISTATTRAASLTVQVKTPYVNSLALFGLVGQSITVTARDAVAGNIIYTKTQTLDGTIITDYYMYFFEPFVQLGEFIVTDIPPYIDCHITIAITSGSTVAIGSALFGTVYFLGDAEYGASAGIIDYSRKETDQFGTTTFIRRAFSNRMNINLMLDNVTLNKVRNILADVRATPCAWIGTDEPGYEPLSLYGFYRDFSLEIAYPTKSYCSLEIEGLT